MGSLDSLKVKQLNAEGIIRQVSTDEPIAVRLRYIGTGTVTSVTVTTATNIVMVTSDGGTDTYAFATYTTVGALIDAINADGIFEARPVDTLRAQSTDSSELVDGAITSSTDIDGVTVWDVTLDTSVALRITVGLHSDDVRWDRPGDHKVHLQEVVYTVNMGTAAADSFQIWKVDGSTEVQVFGELSVDNTKTTLNFASGEGKLTAGAGQYFVALVKDAATLADASGNYVRVSGLRE